MSNDFLTRNQIEKLLTMKKTAIRVTTMEDVQLVRHNIDCLVEHCRKQGMEEAIKEYIIFKEHLDETTIIVDTETEQHIFYTFQYPKYSTENTTLQDSGFMRIDKTKDQ